VKAFGGVLNGLDGNFGFAEKGDQKMNARTNQFWRFPFAWEIPSSLDKSEHEGHKVNKRGH
jgi:hypothetical protein